MMQPQYNEPSQETDLAFEKLENAVREHAQMMQRQQDEQPIAESEAIQ